MSPPIAAADTAPGHSDTLASKPKVPAKAAPVRDEQLVVNTIRACAADLCQQFKGGHPGTVMGAATIGVALWRYAMRYNPSNPEWFARDRFVLSVGHACLLQYLMLHFTGYEAWTFDVIKDYHAAKSHVMAAGHPEIEYPGVEVTTGPLGQGIANAVGMAAAGKSMAANYNKEGFPVVEGKIWCMTGDGCIQEGVGQEALSMAGHWGLDNLIMVYDNNRVTVDGTIDDCFTDDTSAKMKSMKWHVIEVYDGSNDLDAIVKAFDEAKQVKGKPVFVNIRTIIGMASAAQGTNKVHGAALGQADVDAVKKALGFSTDKFTWEQVSDELYDYFKECRPRGEKLEKDWNAMMAEYGKKYPEEYKDFQRRLAGQLKEGWEDRLPKKQDLPSKDTATRMASKIAIGTLAPNDSAVMVGSADIMESCHVDWPGQVEFQNPDHHVNGGTWAGQQIRYGIREHAMVAFANGMAAYHKGMFLPICATYLMFWAYAAAAARMASLQHLRWIGVATHDGLGVGEDGPTHQPIGLPMFFRAVPNMNFLRPADAEETMGAYITAIQEIDTPSLLSLSRQPVPLLPGSDRTKITRGGYIIHSNQPGQTPKLTLLATGAEVWRAVEVAKRLSYPVNVVSMPSLAHFDRQSREYKASVLNQRTSLLCSIEVYASFGWSRYAHAGCHMHTFGMSAPYNTCFEHFGFGVDNLTRVIGAWVDRQGGELPPVGEYEELLLGYAQ